MIVIIEKKRLDEMHTGINENIENLSQSISEYIYNDELESYIYSLLNEIQFYIKEAFNPELIDKSQHIKTGIYTPHELY